MEIIKITRVTDDLAQMVALFRVELRSYKGIISKPNIDAGRQELEEYLAAGFPVFAAVVNGAYAGYVVCRVDGEVVWVESIFVREEYRRLGVASVLHSKAEEVAETLGEGWRAVDVCEDANKATHRLLDVIMEAEDEE